jgi:uncharacterized protein
MSTVAHPSAESRRAVVTQAATALRTEAGLARVGLGVVALHVVDDNFLQPQPGTSAGDHLVSGLVPTTLLLLAAWAYPRLRGGARATVALAAGTFGLVSAVEAVYYTREAGPSGDDYTGLLAVAAGLLLIAVGLVTLWRTRRRDDGPARRYLRRALLALAGVAVIYLVVFPLAAAYVLSHTARAYVPTPMLGTAYDDVAFTTSDGLRLEGWYVPSRNGAAVIVFPGRKGPQKPARMLARHGYGVLLFDRRGEGESQGDPNIFGWDSNRDVKAAVSFLQGRPEVDRNRIGGLGLSVGGEVLLQTAAETDDLKAVVSEGAGVRSHREVLDLSGRNRWLQLPTTALITAGMVVFANDTPPASLTDLVPDIAPRHVFFVYATHGQGGEELNPTYYDAAGQPKAIWEIPEGGHTGGIDARPKQYEQRVVAFFDRALLGARE